jgi:hypothetical protein
MVRLLLTVFVAILALAIGSIPVFAKSSGGRVDNLAATRAYLLARHTLALAGLHDFQAGETAVQTLVAKVKNECSGVLGEAPQSRARDDLRAEITDDVSLTLARPAQKATLAFWAAVQRLRWSNHQLMYYVGHSAREEAAKENVALPDICADAKALAAAGFQAAPATTERFLASSDAANSITTIEFGNGEGGGLEERIFRLLKPYERPDEKALIPHKASRRELEQAVPAFEKEYGTPILEIAHALGLPE